MQILASNTRRTKVLELSSGTHRIPEELKKHFLTDEHGAQYSTNLDRNRYGSDNNYLFTVIKHDLEMLGLCPCLVDVEIIDAKAHGDSQLVNAGHEACGCSARARRRHKATCRRLPPLASAVSCLRRLLQLPQVCSALLDRCTVKHTLQQMPGTTA